MYSSSTVAGTTNPRNPTEITEHPSDSPSAEGTIIATVSWQVTVIVSAEARHFLASREMDCGHRARVPRSLVQNAAGKETNEPAR